MQVKESVNAANLLLVGSQTGQSAPKPQTDTLSSDFASFLTNAGEKVDSEVKVTKDVKTESKSETKDTYAVESVKESQAVPDKVSDDSEVVSTTDDMPTDTTMENVVSSEPVELTEEETRALLELVGQLLQNVMTQFHISVAELSQDLERFDMTVEDLFTQDGLKEFFLQMNSAEVSDLVVDEDLNQELNSFLGECEEILDSLEPLDTPDLDLEALLLDLPEDVVLSDFPDVAELVQYMEEQPPEVLPTKSFMQEQPQEPVQELQVEFVEEPEVIVTKTDTNMKENQDEMSGQQTETPKESIPEHDKTARPEPDRTDRQKPFVNPILQTIGNAVDNVQEITQTDNQPVRGSDVINQIVEQVRIQMNENTTSLEMQLYPEHLGKIQIHIVSKDGIMTARIAAETEAAKQAIENGLTNLKESMQEQNLKVEAIEVMVSTTGFERGNEGQGSETNNQTSKNRRKSDLSEPEQDMTDEDAAEEERMRASGSSVSYTA